MNTRRTTSSGLVVLTRIGTAVRAVTVYAANAVTAEDDGDTMEDALSTRDAVYRLQEAMYGHGFPSRQDRARSDRQAATVNPA